MKFFNAHTHLPQRTDEEVIRCCGLHPWKVDAAWRDTFNLLFGPLHFPGYAPPEMLQAIGECGLDRACHTPYDLQLQAFEAHITESERRHLPIILHCVRATDDVLHLKAGTTQPWVWHGFRGKPQQLQQLLRHGFHVSFGFRHNAESIAACPANRLLLETDDVDAPIKPLYEQVAALRHTTAADLQRQLWETAHTLFANMPP